MLERPKVCIKYEGLNQLSYVLNNIKMEQIAGVDVINHLRM